MTAPDTETTLSAGFAAYDSMQYTTARQCFQQILAGSPADTDALEGLQLVTQAMVPRWHFSMLNDVQRNDCYDQAIRRLVTPDSVVLDVGSGSGLLAMMAARAGARRIYTCEMNQPIAEMARRVVAENGFADVIKVIGKKSDQLLLGEDLDEKADLLITETLDSQLLGEGIIPIVRDARARLLVDGAKVIPCGARIFGALVSAEAVWELNHVTSASGFDVSLFNEYATADAYPVRLSRFAHRFLSASAEFCAFDFERDALDERHFEVAFAATDSAPCHAVAFWYDLELGGENVIHSDPTNEESHWKQAIQCFAEPVEVQAGKRYVLTVRQKLTGFEYTLGPA